LKGAERKLIFSPPPSALSAFRDELSWPLVGLSFD
jgi:hypothetical protein